MGLIIHHGSPWWLSPDIWVTKAGGSKTSPHEVHPIAGEPYDVWVQVWNPTSAAIEDWSLFIVWAAPTAGPIPLTAATPLNETTIGVPAKSPSTFKAASVWTPSFVYGGHECLVAYTYWNGIPSPYSSLDGDLPPGQSSSIAQHNLGVVELGKKRSFMYSFQVCNSEPEQRDFVVAAYQAPLSEFEQFIQGLPVTQPGTAQNLGLTTSAPPNPSELEAENPTHVVLGPKSCSGLGLVGTLDTGAALIHVTQKINQQIVGGLSVLVLAD